MPVQFRHYTTLDAEKQRVTSIASQVTCPKTGIPWIALVVIFCGVEMLLKAAHLTSRFPISDNKRILYLAMCPLVLFPVMVVFLRAAARIVRVRIEALIVLSLALMVPGCLYGSVRVIQWVQLKTEIVPVEHLHYENWIGIVPLAIMVCTIFNISVANAFKKVVPATLKQSFLLSALLSGAITVALGMFVAVRQFAIGIESSRFWLLASIAFAGVVEIGFCRSRGRLKTWHDGLACLMLVLAIFCGIVGWSQLVLDWTA